MSAAGTKSKHGKRRRVGTGAEQPVAPAPSNDHGCVENLLERVAALEEELESEIDRRDEIERSRAYRLSRRALNLAGSPIGLIGSMTRRARRLMLDAMDLMPRPMEGVAQFLFARLGDEDEEAWVEVPSLAGVSRRAATSHAVVLFLVLGPPPGEMETLISNLAGMRARGRRLRPLIVTDWDRFDLLRQSGLLFEYIPPRSELEARFPSVDYEGYLRDRLGQVIRAYQPDALLGVSAGVMTAMVTDVIAGS